MRFLFLTDGENLTPRQSKQLDLLFEAYPQFQTPYLLKEAFRNVYQFAETRVEAEQMFAAWVQANTDEECHVFDGQPYSLEGKNNQTDPASYNETG